MGREFDGSTEYLSNTGWSGDWTSSGLTMACWFQGNNSKTTGQGLIAIQRNGGGWADRMRLTYQTNVGGDPIRVETRSASGPSNNADTSSGVTDTNWHHAAACINSSGHCTVYLDGGSSASDTSSTVSPLGTINSIYLGAWVPSGSADQFLDGILSWPCVWDVELSAAEVADLAAATHPLLVRPDDVLWFPGPMSGTGGESAWIGSPNLTETGSILDAESYPVTLGMVTFVTRDAGVVAGGGAVWRLAGQGGLAGHGGLAGRHGGLAG